MICVSECLARTQRACALWLSASGDIRKFTVGAQWAIWSPRWMQFEVAIRKYLGAFCPRTSSRSATALRVAVQTSIFCNLLAFTTVDYTNFVIATLLFCRMTSLLLTCDIFAFVVIVILGVFPAIHACNRYLEQRSFGSDMCFCATFR